MFRAPALISIFCLSQLAFENSAFAWGKRGHSIVCETAAQLSSQSPKAEFMSAHSFDLGYYCNVPDLVWKKGDLYDLEWFNHFMDMEIFDRDLKSATTEKPFEMDRLAFNAAFPQIKDSAGRAFWRIRELFTAADLLTTQLKKTDLAREERQKLQADWLVHVGTMGHYVGDLAQPLHVTENYDGQMTDQKGVHAWFEDELVDGLFLAKGMGLEAEVMQAARAKWARLKTKDSARSVLEVVDALAVESNKSLKTLLNLDKKIGRKDPVKARRAFHAMIVERMASGAVVLAGLWNRQLGWDFDGKKFYAFSAEPKFIAPPKAAPATPAPTAAPMPGATPQK